MSKKEETCGRQVWLTRETGRNGDVFEYAKPAMNDLMEFHLFVWGTAFVTLAAIASIAKLHTFAIPNQPTNHLRWVRRIVGFFLILFWISSIGLAICLNWSNIVSAVQRNAHA